MSGFLAAAVAFYGFLAFVPLLAATVLVYGLAAEPETVAEHIRKLFGMLAERRRRSDRRPAEEHDRIAGLRQGMEPGLRHRVAVYGASKGAGAIVTALNIAYEVKESRGLHQVDPAVAAMTIGALVVLGIAAGAISVMGWARPCFPAFPAGRTTRSGSCSGRGPRSRSGVALAAVYRYAPNRPDAPWGWISPGSAAATLLWLLASLGLASTSPIRQLQRHLRLARRSRRLPHLALPFRLHPADGRRAQFRARAPAGGRGGRGSP